MEADLPLVHAVPAAQATELSNIIDLTSNDADTFKGFESDPWSAVGRTVIVPKDGMPQDFQGSSPAYACVVKRFVPQLLWNDSTVAPAYMLCCDEIVFAMRMSQLAALLPKALVTGHEEDSDDEAHLEDFNDFKDLVEGGVEERLPPIYKLVIEQYGNAEQTENLKHMVNNPGEAR